MCALALLLLISHDLQAARVIDPKAPPPAPKAESPAPAATATQKIAPPAPSAPAAPASPRIEPGKSAAAKPAASSQPSQQPAQPASAKKPEPPRKPDLDALSAELDGLSRDPGFAAKAWGALEDKLEAAGQADDANAPRALFLLGRLREERGGRFAAVKDLRAARKTYGEIPRRFPKSGLADDAQYRRALVARDLLGDADASKADLQMLLKEYPAGDMASKAKLALSGGGPRLELVSPHPAQQAPQQAQTVAKPGPANNANKAAPAAGGKPAPESKPEVKSDVKPDAKPDAKAADAKGKGGQPPQSVAQSPQAAPQPASQPAPPPAPEPSVAAAGGAAPGKQPMQPLGPYKSAKAGSGQKPAMLLEQLGLSVRTVMIDAGHGGKDPGAVANGVKEKDVALKVSLYLGEELRKRGFEVAYTRSKDVFIPLEARPAMANKRKADLFVSIHCNAAPDPSAHGIETYTLNWARTVDAVRVASRENAAASRGVGELKTILSDLLAGSRKKESDDLAGSVQAETLRCARDSNFLLRDHGTKEGPFYVLVGATMPAALVELGYLTNKEEADRLKTDAYQRALAKGLADGIVSYKRRIERFAAQ